MASLLKKICGRPCWIAWLALLIFIGCQNKELTTAKVYIQQNEWNKAMVPLEKAVAENPGNAEAQFLLGRGYAEQQRWADMKRAFAASLRASPQFALEIKSWEEHYFSEQFNQGARTARDNDWAAAREAFVAALQIDPANSEAYRHLAYVYDKLGQPEKALQIYGTLLGMNPNDWEACVAMAGIHTQRHEYGKSVALLEQALTKAPREPQILVQLALIYDLQGKKDETLAAYQQALQIQPDDKDLLLAVARFYLAKEDYAGALQEFSKVLTIEADNFEATYHAGLCYLKLGERLQKQWRSQRDRPAGSAQNGELRLAAFRNYEAAAPFLRKAVALDSLHAGAYFNLGFAYTRLGEEEKAKDAFKRCEELQKTINDK